MSHQNFRKFYEYIGIDREGKTSCLEPEMVEDVLQVRKTQNTKQVSSENRGDTCTHMFIFREKLRKFTFRAYARKHTEQVGAIRI